MKNITCSYHVYESDESLPNLLSGCPVLEELDISISAISKCMDCWHICSSTLKILILKSDYLNLAYKAYGLKLDTPALTYLRIEGFEFTDVSAGVLTHLIEADLDFDLTLEFIGNLRNVKRLKLTKGLLKASNSIFSDLTVKFHRLTKLELAGDWGFLSYFLGNADNLEILILHKGDTDLQYWMEPHSVPICLSSHLRIVRIFGRSRFSVVKFGRSLFSKVELESINYILSNAKVLERMEIYPKHKDVLKRIRKENK